MARDEFSKRFPLSIATSPVIPESVVATIAVTYEIFATLPHYGLEDFPDVRNLLRYFVEEGFI